MAVIILTYDRNIKVPGRRLKLNIRIFQTLKKISRLLCGLPKYTSDIFLIEWILLINWKSLYNLLNKCLLMTLILNYFRIYFFSYDQRRWEPNNLSLKVQISLYLCTYDSCISLPPSFLSFLLFPGRVKGFLFSVQIILCIFHNTWIFFFTSFSRRVWLLEDIFCIFST